MDEETDTYFNYCVDCCAKYCGGHEYMGSELCLCDCDTICCDVYDECGEEEYEEEFEDEEVIK